MKMITKMANENEIDSNSNDINIKFDIFEDEVNINTHKSGLIFYMNINTFCYWYFF
jgi:hypothetical protein